jgi:hypothetical protein
MQLNPAVYDIWVFRRAPAGVQFLLLHTSKEKADRHFGGGRFWQIPSGVFEDAATVADAFGRHLAGFGIDVLAVWAAEHTYTIYNRRFHEIQIISVFAVEADANDAALTLDPAEHSEYEWVSYQVALDRVHYRGLKDGLRSVHEYITSPRTPAPELRLR